MDYNAHECGFVLSARDKTSVIKLTFDDATTWSHCHATTEGERTDPAKCLEYIQLYDGPDDQAPLIKGAYLDGCAPLDDGGAYVKRPDWRISGRSGQAVECLGAEVKEQLQSLSKLTAKCDVGAGGCIDSCRGVGDQDAKYGGPWMKHTARAIKRTFCMI